MTKRRMHTKFSNLPANHHLGYLILQNVLQDAFEKRSRGASVEPPVTRPAEPYDPNNESPSDEDEDDDIV